MSFCAKAASTPPTPLAPRCGGSRAALTMMTWLILVIAARSEAATWFVADKGSDSSTCGVTSTTPCRSVTQAIANAIDGDTISVGPGRYGDLNRNGVLGEAGEENGAPACSCVLLVDKAVIVLARVGAAVTMIDGRFVNVTRNVLIADDGATFGQIGKGFAVTQTAYGASPGYNDSHGVVIAANSVVVRGNQVLYTDDEDVSLGRGIHVGNQLHSVVIEGNLVTDWAVGIDARPGTTISQNQVLDNGSGIYGDGGQISGNVATGNDFGVFVTGAAVITGNAAYANRDAGVVITVPFSGVFSKNNLFGNGCGVLNLSVVGLVATNNYWGGAAGPGVGGGDYACSDAAGTTDTTPFATKPFAVKVQKP